ncbi:MAG: DUF3857 domain-containing transglutaminase family protein [Acidobacteriaceae bacterium]
MRKAIRRLALAAVCACSVVWSAAAYAGSAAAPDWVKQAAAQTLPAYPADTRAVVLLEETTLTVEPDGRAVEHVRRVVKILRPQGRGYGEIYVPFSASTRVNYLHVWSIGPDGHEYALKDNEIGEEGTAGWGILYQDLRVKIAEAPGRDPNAVIAYEYEQKVPPYIFEDTWDIQESIPKLHERYILELPPGWEYKSSWHRHAPVEPSASGSRYQWELRDVAAVDLRDVPAAPAAKAMRARAVISYFGGGRPRVSGDWRAIGEWYQQLAQERAKSSPEVAAKAAELVAGKTDFADKAQAIGEYVQQHIRYVAIEIGIGGLQPHAATDIFRSRSGDCKDKATLLAAMLSSVGIRSTWVLVDTERGFMTPEAPSVDGDHVIAAIELPAGYRSDRLHSVVTAKDGKRFLIFDPTWEYTPFGTLEWNLQGSYGVLVDGEDSQLVALPQLTPDLNTIVRTAHFALHDDGSLTGDVTERESGDIATYWRSLYQMGSEKDQRQEMQRTLGRDLGSFTLGTDHVENTTVLTKDFVQQYAVTVPLYARQSGSLLLLRPRVLGTDSMLLDHKERHYPVELGATKTVKDEFDVELPAGYAVDELPDPVKVDAGFASYQSKTEVRGDTLHYSREYVVRELELAPEKYAALQQFVGEIEQDERAQAVLKKKD